MMFRIETGQSMHGGACLLYGLLRRRTATFESREESRVITALTKCVVPIVTLAMEEGVMEEEANMVVMAFVMAWLGLAVVGALCLF